jgi:hypothetical protein
MQKKFVDELFRQYFFSSTSGFTVIIDLYWISFSTFYAGPVTFANSYQDFLANLEKKFDRWVQIFCFFQEVLISLPPFLGENAKIPSNYCPAARFYSSPLEICGRIFGSNATWQRGRLKS